MHAMGEWMVSYRYMTMDMEGLLKGSDDVTAASQLGMSPKFMMVPTEMTRMILRSLNTRQHQT